MENTKIGNKEAIALLTTISFNQIIIFGVKSIINNTSSASLLNLLYLSIIILIFTILICYLLNKFPSFDLLDISDYLGGKILKWIVGILFFIYFIIFAGNSLHLFSSCLEIIYFPFARSSGFPKISASLSRPHISYTILLTSSRPESIRSSALFCV